MTDFESIVSSVRIENGRHFIEAKKQAEELKKDLENLNSVKDELVAHFKRESTQLAEDQEAYNKMNTDFRQIDKTNADLNEAVNVNINIILM